MYIIPISTATSDLIAGLNGGVYPDIEPDMYFIYRGPGLPSSIVSDDEFAKLPPAWMILRIMYRNE